MHLRHSVKKKTALLIQPSKPPEMPRERSSKLMEVPLPADEDHDYESTSYTCTDLSMFYLDLWCIKSFLCFTLDLPESEYVEVLPD